MSLNTFTCCIGECKFILHKNPIIITNHIRKYHNQAYNQLKISSYAHYCNYCDTFTNYTHYHCKLCDENFDNKHDVVYHYNLYHKKWFLEEDCYWAQDCKKNTCKYNHYDYDKNYIVEKLDIIPQSVCPYDLPWINIRCANKNCTFDHFKNR
jgi:hypothetical protein